MKKTIGSDILKGNSGNLPKPNAAASKEYKKFLEKRQKKTKEEETEVRYKMPDREGEPSDQDLIKQNQELTEEKHAFSAGHNSQLNDSEDECNDNSSDGGKN